MRSPGPTPPSPPPRRRGLLVPLALLAVVVVVAAVLIAGGGGGGGGGERHPSTRASSPDRGRHGRVAEGHRRRAARARSGHRRHVGGDARSADPARGRWRHPDRRPAELPRDRPPRSRSTPRSRVWAAGVGRLRRRPAATGNVVEAGQGTNLLALDSQAAWIGTRGAGHGHPRRSRLAPVGIALRDGSTRRLRRWVRAPVGGLFRRSRHGARRRRGARRASPAPNVASGTVGVAASNGVWFVSSGGTLNRMDPRTTLPARQRERALRPASGVVADRRRRERGRRVAEHERDLDPEPGDSLTRARRDAGRGRREDHRAGHVRGRAGSPRRWRSRRVGRHSERPRGHPDQLPLSASTCSSFRRRRRSARAISKSTSVRPPAEWLVSDSRTLFQPWMRMSG